MFEFRSILCAAAHSPEVDDGVVSHALKIALEGDAELILGRAHGEDLAPTSEDEQALLRALLSRWGRLPDSSDGRALAELGIKLTCVHVPGHPEANLADLAAERRPDLMVLGTQPRTGSGRWIKPSIAEAMTQVARLPTLFVPSGAGGLVSQETGDLRLGRVLVPVAAWPDASRAAQLAQQLISTLRVAGVRYRTLFVGSRRDAPTLDRMPDRAIWEHKDREGSVVSAILNEADEFSADLIVMATEGHDSLGDQLLGSTVERVVRESGCPVLAAPPPI